MINLGTYDKYRDVCRGVKAGNQRAIEDAADMLSMIVPSDAVIVPMPSHHGVPTYTLEIAKSIASRIGCMVDSCLVGSERPMLYAMKKNNQIQTFGFELIHKPVGNVILLDNVIDTGLTYRQAKRAIGNVPIITIAKT